MPVQADRVGDYIRGVGLYVGVEMVKDAANKEPDGALAAASSTASGIGMS
ncbi:MAG: hypothetical protein ABF893_10745 [Gluconacetobacter liquefaciens]